jgi:4-aminobutyrate aminotransferase-like enzyme
LKEIVSDHGGLFIHDEVQTGWGRTGSKWFGIEHWDVVPDIITSAKGLANGLPIGLTVAKADVADSVKGISVSTFGGNPVAATAPSAVIDYIEDRNLLVNAAAVGGLLRSRLLELQERYAVIGDVRAKACSKGLNWLKTELRKPRPPVMRKSFWKPVATTSFSSVGAAFPQIFYASHRR